MELYVVSYDHPDAVTLIAELQQFYLRVYGQVDDTPVDPDEFTPPRGLFMIGYGPDSMDADATDADRADSDRANGSRRPLACGGWRNRADNPLLQDTDVEIKRMFVVPAARGRGYARLLLGELERTARDHGHKRMVLETGIEQPEAMNFYRTSGYVAVTPFGHHRRDARVRYFGKELLSPG